MVEATPLTEAYFDEFPEQAADAMESMPVAETAPIVESLPARVVAPTFTTLSPAYGSELLNALTPETRAAIIERLHAAAAARFVRRLDSEVQMQLLETLSGKSARALRLALSYSAGTVGALMRADVPTLTTGGTVGMARMRVRDMPAVGGNQFYVVDRRGKLEGRVDMVALLQRDEDVPLGDLMDRQFDALPDRAMISQAAGSPGWDRARFLPVVDRAEHFLGVLSHADVQAALRRRQARPGHAQQVRLSNAPLEICKLYVGGMLWILDSLSSTDSGKSGSPGSRSRP